MPLQIRIPCPECPPWKKPALSVDQVKGIFHCFRCGLSGKFKGQFHADLLESDHVSHVENLPWPESYMPLDPYEPRTTSERLALKYLSRRRIRLEQIRRHKMGYCARGLYEGRIIVPFSIGGDLKYFVARSIRSNEPKKYLNPKVPKNGFVFKTFIGKVKLATIVEGVFDALSVEHVMPAMALLGKSPSQKQLQNIGESTERALLMLDADAVKDSLEIIDRINYYIPTTRITLKSGDPGGLTEEELYGVIGQVR